MAIINDPDDLNQGVEIDISTASKEITLNLTGNLSEDGVTLHPDTVAELKALGYLE